MLNWISKKLNFIKLLGSQKTGNSNTSSGKSRPLSEKIDVNLERIKKIFTNASDVIIREFQLGCKKKVRASIIFIDGMANKESISEHIMKPLLLELHLCDQTDKMTPKNAFMLAKEKILSIAEVKEVTTLEDVTKDILSGETVLFIDSFNIALVASTRGWEARSVEEPDTEAVIRGPREGFTETLRTSTAQLRRKIKSPNLKLEHMKIGRQTQTEICIAYIAGIANDKVVEEVRSRLEDIDTDSILESGYIEQFIEDAPLSIFPTVGNTEKPDTVAAKILEGRVAILTDGTPFVLTVPYLIIEAFQSAEDYYSRPYLATFIRWLRIAAFLLTVFLPALYVAITTFHQEMLPPALLSTIAAAEEGTPFPIMVEALIMAFIYEILREAGVRLPRPVGQAVSIVGALVIGEAAISAGLVGAPMVLIIALTAISSFVVPSLTDAATIIRFGLIIAAAILGQIGIMLLMVAILTHLNSLRSFGAPYLSPLAPTTRSDFKDTIIRAPLWMMFTRPRVIAGKNSVRQKFRLMPEPPNDTEKS